MKDFEGSRTAQNCCKKFTCKHSKKVGGSQFFDVKLVNFDDLQKLTGATGYARRRGYRQSHARVPRFMLNQATELFAGNIRFNCNFRLSQAQFSWVS